MSSTDQIINVHKTYCQPHRGGGGVLSKVRFGLGEENWSLEIFGGGCSAKGRIWTGEENWSFGILGEGGRCSAKGRILTQGRKLEFEILGGGLFLLKVGFGLGEEIGVWKFGRGVLPKVRFGLEKKIGVLVIFLGGAEVFLPIWSKISGSLACLCITDSLSHTTWRLIKQLD